jgi:hypothetical protein
MPVHYFNMSIKNGEHMRKIFIVFSLIFCFSLTYSQKNIFVSPKGNDQNDGSIENPFLSLNKALYELKESINSGKAGKEATIFMRSGVYYLQNTIEFDSSTFSKTHFKIAIKPYQDEKVIITGAKKITGFTKLADEKVLERISKEYRDKIYSINLKANGVDDYGEISMRGSGGMEFFFNDERMTLSRYPNKGWLKIADIPQSGDSLYNKGLDREKRYDGVPVGRHYGKINYDGERPNKWSKDNEIYMHGFWTFDWSDSYQKIKFINPERHEITIAEPHHNYGYTKNQRYYFVNILEELDTPGEWYLDRNLGILYFYAPSDPNNSLAEVSILDKPFIKLNGTNNITIENITFEKARGNAIIINNGRNNIIAGCTFRLIGDVVIDIEGGTQNGVLSCDVYDVALGGITLNAGDRKTLTASGSFVKNCHIHDYSKWVTSGYLGIRLSGVGNLLSNNLIHNAPHEAIYISGNDQILEYNEVYNVCNETGDAGATHTGRNYTWRGNIYRYNYFHHLRGPGLHGVTAIYLDDFSSGFQIYGNICYKSGRGTLVGGGRDNIIENNVFIDCHPSIVLDARGLSWASYYFNGTYPYLFTTLDEMNYSQSPYVTKYPILKNIKEDQPAVPKNNKFLNNISYGGRWIELLDYFAYDFKKEITFKNNLIGDKEVCKRIKEDPKGWEPYYLNLDCSDGYRVYTNSDEEIKKEFKNDLFIDKDPGFVDYANQNFNLKKNSPAFKLGFKPIPIEKIGLFVDNYRKILPKKETKFDF